MNRRWIFVTLFVLMLGALVATAIATGPRGDWDGHRGVDVVRVANDSDVAATRSGDTIIIERGRGWGFFPFGFFLIPLAFFLFFGLIGRAFWGSRRWEPNGGPPSTAWLDEWHRKQHQQMDSPGDDQNRPTTSQAE